MDTVKPALRSRRVWVQILNWVEVVGWAVFLWAINDQAVREYAIQWARGHLDAALVPLALSAGSAVLAYLSRRYPSARP